MAKITADYIDHMGDDLRVANAARVSFDKQSTWDFVEVPDDKRTWHEDEERYTKVLKQSDRNLIAFLARGCTNGDWDRLAGEFISTGDEPLIKKFMKVVRHIPKHWTPFGHCQITLRETVPIFVARQRFKHMVGQVYNEISRRYVIETPTFYIPDGWRKAAKDKKQGSTNELIKQFQSKFGFGEYDKTYFDDFYGGDIVVLKEYESPIELLDRWNEMALKFYQHLLDEGAAPEQARMVLPQNMMTTYWVTGSLYAFANSYANRSRSDAQKEIQVLAEKWDEIIRPLYPVSWSALVDVT